MRSATNRGNGVGLLLITLGLLSVLAPRCVHAQEVDRQVKRFDPVTREPALVPADEILQGKIYQHYNKRMGRRVWAFAREGGTFSHALGEGTTQPTSRFDLPFSTEQQMAIVAEVAPRWARALEQIGSKIFVRLQVDDNWKLVQHAAIPCLYDLETQRRWEWHGDRRVAVGHSAGYRWLVEEGRYRPAIRVLYGVSH